MHSIIKRIEDGTGCRAEQWGNWVVIHTSKEIVVVDPKQADQALHSAPWKSMSICTPDELVELQSDVLYNLTLEAVVAPLEDLVAFHEEYGRWPAEEDRAMQQFYRIARDEGDLGPTSDTQTTLEFTSPQGVKMTMHAVVGADGLIIDVYREGEGEECRSIGWDWGDLEPEED